MTDNESLLFLELDLARGFFLEEFVADLGATLGTVYGSMER